MAFCPNCRAELAENAQFCTACGYQLNTQPQQPQQAAPEHQAPETPQAPYQAPFQPQNPYGYADPQFAPPVENPPLRKNGAGIAAMVLSIVSLVFCWLAVFDFIFIVPGLICLIIAFIKMKNRKKGATIAAAIMLVIAIILSLFLTSVYTDAFDDSYEDADYDYSSYSYDYNKLQSAYSTYCSSTYADLASDNSYLTIDTNPSDIDDYINSSAWSAVKNVNSYLGFPSSVNELMSSTRALDGRQNYTGSSYSVSWTYHPDQGLEVLYTKN